MQKGDECKNEKNKTQHQIIGKRGRKRAQTKLAKMSERNELKSKIGKDVDEKP